MTGKSYAYAMTQLDIQVVLHPDAHIFAQEYLYQAKPNFLISIMTQLSLKASLKELGYKACSSSKSYMNQMHLRNTFITMHRCDMTYKELQIVLELHMFLKKKRDCKIKGQTVSEGNKQRT